MSCPRCMEASGLCKDCEEYLYGDHKMIWQCRYIDSNGNRCTNDAIKRIHFAAQHPLDHTDLCTEHLKEYKVFVWCEELEVTQ